MLNKKNQLHASIVIESSPSMQCWNLALDENRANA